MKNPLISIFIPTYNRPALLKTTIESCLTQDIESYEIVVADDGSTDDTPQMVERFVEQSDKIVYLRLPENTKGMKVYNLARQIRGRFIFRIGDDDILRPNVLSKYAEAVLEDKARIVYGDMRLFSEDGAVNRIQQYSDYSDKPDRLLQDLLHGNCFPFPGSMIDIDLYWRHLVRLGYPGFRGMPVYKTINLCAGRAIDYLEWILLAGTGRRFKHIPETTVDYRVHSAQDSNPMYKNGSDESFVARMILALHSIREIFPNESWEEDPLSAEVRFLLTVGKVMSEVYDSYNAAACYRSALALHPLPPALEEEATIGFIRTIFNMTGSPPEHVPNTSNSLAEHCADFDLRNAGQMLETYRKLSDTTRKILSAAERLVEKNELDGACEMLEKTAANPATQTAPTLRLLSEVYRRRDMSDLAYHCAIFSAAVSGYASPYYEDALALCEPMGRSEELIRMCRRTLIQPVYLMRGFYPPQVLEGTDFQAAEHINRRESKFYLGSEVEALAPVPS